MRQMTPYAPETPKEPRSLEPEDKQDDTIINGDSESAGHLSEDQSEAEHPLSLIVSDTLIIHV